MKPMFRAMLRRENAPTSVALVVSVLLVAARLAAAVDDTALSIGILLVLSALATSLIIQRVTVLEGIENSLTEIKGRASFPVIDAFYAERSELPRLEEYLGGAREEIFAAGIGLNYLAGIQMGLLVAKAEAGCEVKLLLMAPMVEVGTEPLLQKTSKLIGAPGLELQTWIHSSLDRIMRAKAQLEAGAAERIEVRIHRQIPSLVLLCTDASRATGRIRVELLPYGFDPRNRPSFELTPQAGGSLYQLLYDTYRELWRESSAWPIVE